MRLTRALYNRIVRKRFYRLQRPDKGQGEFHLVDSREDGLTTACYQLVGAEPETYVPGDRAQLCAECYDRVMARGGVA